MDEFGKPMARAASKKLPSDTQQEPAKPKTPKSAAGAKKKGGATAGKTIGGPNKGKKKKAAWEDDDEEESDHHQSSDSDDIFGDKKRKSSNNNFIDDDDDDDDGDATPRKGHDSDSDSGSSSSDDEVVMKKRKPQKKAAAAAPAKRGRKPASEAGPKKPGRKRKVPETPAADADGDDGGAGGGGDGDDDGEFHHEFREGDFARDDADARYLQSLPEFEREQEIFTRQEARNKAKNIWLARQKMLQQQQQKDGGGAGGARKQRPRRDASHEEASKKLMDRLSKGATEAVSKGKKGALAAANAAAAAAAAAAAKGKKGGAGGRKRHSDGDDDDDEDYGEERNNNKRRGSDDDDDDDDDDNEDGEGVLRRKKDNDNNNNNKSSRDSNLDELFAPSSSSSAKDAAGNNNNNNNNAGQSSDSFFDGSSSARKKKPSTLSLDRLTLDQLERMRVSRDKLVGWVNEPYAAKLIGGFVRLNIGARDGVAVYRACEILNVQEKMEEYAVPIGGGREKRLSVGLRAKFGDSTKVFPFSLASNQPFTESELNRWLRAMRDSDIALPNELVIKQISTAVSEDWPRKWKYNEEEVKQKVERSMQNRSRPVDIAAQRILLESTREEATRALERMREEKLKKKNEENENEDGNKNDEDELDEDGNKKPSDADLVMESLEKQIEQCNLDLRKLHEYVEELDRRRDNRTLSVQHINSRHRLMNANKSSVAPAQNNQHDPTARRREAPIMVWNVEAAAKRVEAARAAAQETSNNGANNNDPLSPHASTPHGAPTPKFTTLADTHREIGLSMEIDQEDLKPSANPAPTAALQVPKSAPPLIVGAENGGEKPKATMSFGEWKRRTGLK